MNMNTNKHKGLNISIQNSSRRQFGVLVSHPVNIRSCFTLPFVCIFFWLFTKSFKWIFFINQLKEAASIPLHVGENSVLIASIVSEIFVFYWPYHKSIKWALCRVCDRDCEVGSEAGCVTSLFLTRLWLWLWFNIYLTRKVSWST